MVNLSDESELGGRLLTPHELAELAPSIRKGRKASAATVKRWMRSGLHGERLPYVMSGLQPCSTQEALMQFFRRLATRDENKRFVATDQPDGLSNLSKSKEVEDQRLALDNQQARRLGL